MAGLDNIDHLLRPHLRNSPKLPSLLAHPSTVTSFMGSSSRELRVRIRASVSHTPASCRNYPSSESGEWWGLAMSPGQYSILLPHQDRRDQVRLFTVLDSHRLKNYHPPEHRPGSSSLKIVLYIRGPGSAFTRNGTGSMPRGSTFSFIFEVKSKSRARSRPASVLCK